MTDTVGLSRPASEGRRFDQIAGPIKVSQHRAGLLASAVKVREPQRDRDGDRAQGDRQAGPGSHPNGKFITWLSTKARRPTPRHSEQGGGKAERRIFEGVARRAGRGRAKSLQHHGS